MELTLTELQLFVDGGEGTDGGGTDCAYIHTSRRDKGRGEKGCVWDHRLISSFNYTVCKVVVAGYVAFHRILAAV